MKARILVVDDEENIRFVFREFLAYEGHDVVVAEQYDAALREIDAGSFDLIFVDVILGKHTGIDLLGKVREKGLNCPVVVMTGQPDLETAAASVRLGAFDYLSKPVLKDALFRVLTRALEQKAMIDEREHLLAEKERYRQNLETIFRSVKDGILTVNTAMEVIEANQSMETICGLAYREMPNKFLCGIKNECSQACCAVLKETLKSQKTIREYRISCEHNRRPDQVVVLSSSPLKDEHNHFIGAVMVIRDITRLTDLEKELKQRNRFDAMVGKNERLQEIYKLVENVSDTDSTVLITGESGTGKELIANAIHYTGKRSYKSLVKVNCCALSENLLESELFGHVKGAFTGAIKDKRGRFEMAHGGTLLLDEIGDIAPRIQLKLLRVLQEKEVERVGDSNPIKVDVRILASTNSNLKEKVRRGEFRQDLYYRLNVVEIKLPSLRERRDDVPLLIDHFCSLLNTRFHKNIGGVSADVLKLFMQYHWPGNIREMEHALEHAFVVSGNDVIQMDDLPSELIAFSTHPRTGLLHPAIAGEEIRPDDGDCRTLLHALKRAGWNKAKAARLLGVSRQTLYRKMSEYCIEEPQSYGT